MPQMCHGKNSFSIFLFTSISRRTEDLSSTGIYMKTVERIGLNRTLIILIGFFVVIIIAYILEKVVSAAERKAINSVQQGELKQIKRCLKYF